MVDPAFVKCPCLVSIARNCPAKSLRVKEELEQVLLFGEGEVNGQPVQRIQIDSGASRTVVDRRLVPVKDISEETITVTFGNGTSGEYPLAPVRVTFDGDEYEVKAAVVQGLTGDVLSGRDVPLHKHMVSRLPRGEQMDLLRQLAEKHHVQIQETKEEETAMVVMTQAEDGSTVSRNVHTSRKPRDPRQQITLEKSFRLRRISLSPQQGPRREQRGGNTI